MRERSTLDVVARNVLYTARKFGIPLRGVEVTGDHHDYAVLMDPSQSAGTVLRIDATVWDIADPERADLTNRLFAAWNPLAVGM